MPSETDLCHKNHNLTPTCRTITVRNISTMFLVKSLTGPPAGECTEWEGRPWKSHCLSSKLVSSSLLSTLHSIVSDGGRHELLANSTLLGLENTQSPANSQLDQSRVAFCHCNLRVVLLHHGLPQDSADANNRTRNAYIVFHITIAA